MAIDFQQAVANYGYVAIFAQSNKDVKKVLDQAVNEEWDSARFERALWDTNWWKTTNENRRQQEILQATDPATYNNNLQEKKNTVDRIALGMGKSGYDGLGIANLALSNGWTDADLTTYIADHTKFRDGGKNGLTGSAGEIESHLRETYASYGIGVSKATINWQAGLVLGGTNTLGGLDNEIRGQAKKLYPQYKEQLDAGQTLRQIADPYITTMANTLEIADSTIKLTDPKIKKALQGTDGKAVPLWDFERGLKNDARWDKTKQAHDEAYGLVQQIGKDFGFSY